MALMVRMSSSILRMLITQKRKMPKLCMGRSSCQTALVGSVAVQMGISMMAKRISTMKRRMTAPEIWLGGWVLF